MADLKDREPDHYLDEMDASFMDLTDPAPAFGTRTWTPAVDVRETDRTYVLEADLPGMEDDDVEVKVESDKLTLSSSKEEELETDEDGYIRHERYFRSFSRTFKLPADVNEEKIHAKFQKGVLTITMPRSSKAKRDVGRTIEVKGH